MVGLDEGIGFLFRFGELAQARCCLVHTGHHGHVTHGDPGGWLDGRLLHPYGDRWACGCPLWGEGERRRRSVAQPPANERLRAEIRRTLWIEWGLDSGEFPGDIR